MRALVIYESLTGNTRRAAGLVARALERGGCPATTAPLNRIDYQALAEADLVVVGSWTDGFLVVGQRPGRSGRLRELPAMHAKRAAVFCTYAINPGRTLDKLVAIVEAKGADVVGGMAMHRSDLDGAAEDFAARLLAAVPAGS